MWRYTVVALCGGSALCLITLGLTFASTDHFLAFGAAPSGGTLDRIQRSPEFAHRALREHRADIGHAARFDVELVSALGVRAGDARAQLRVADRARRCGAARERARLRLARAPGSATRRR